MSFKPVGDRHAILEVVFQLVFLRPFEAEELDRLAGSHDSWKSDLPKMERMSVFQFAMVPENAPPPDTPQPAAPVSFSSFKRDGGVEWKMQIRDNWIAVNCLAYSRWASISKQANALLSKVLKQLDTDQNPLNSISLQYVDKFLWDGDEKGYDVNTLLNGKSGFFPASFSPTFPAWHLHKGEFSFHEEEEFPHRILNRVHLDASVDENIPSVKIDTVLRVDLKQPQAAKSEEIIARIPSFFDMLHLENKNLLSDVINDEAKDMISLFGDVKS